MTMTAANDVVCDISKVGANDCGRAFTQRHCRRPLLEYPIESFVQATDHSWKNSQARPRRLRPQAPNLRQHSRCPRDPLEVRASNHLLVAQHEAERGHSAAFVGRGSSLFFAAPTAHEGQRSWPSSATSRSLFPIRKRPPNFSNRHST